MRVKVEMDDGWEIYLTGDLADDFIESSLNGDDFFKSASKKIFETRQGTSPKGLPISCEVPFIEESFTRFDRVVSYQTRTRYLEDL